MKASIEPRKNFYADEMNYERMETKLEEVAQELTLAETLKMIREISYDMVYYNNDKDCGVIYKGGYTDQNQWEACQIQRLLSAACDLFGQSIINHREFGGYLDHWINGGAMENKIEDLKNEIESLKEERKELNNRIRDLEEMIP